MFEKNRAMEKFDEFLMILADQTDALEGEAEERGIELDFSTTSLPNLERLFCLMAEGADKDTIDRLIVYFARYLGEIVRTAYGGRWFLPLDDPKNVNFNSPVIVGHSPIKDLEFAPIGVMRAFALRRKPGTLWRAIDADINPNPINLDDLIEE